MQKIKLTVNGKKQEVTADPEMVLIDLLRQDLHLTEQDSPAIRKIFR